VTTSEAERLGRAVVDGSAGYWPFAPPGWTPRSLATGESQEAVGDHHERQPRCTALLPVAQLLPAALTGRGRREPSGLKPEIAEAGHYGIPIRDDLEAEHEVVQSVRRGVGSRE
jgi:hypothetical protein